MISKMPDYITVRMLEEGKLLKEKDSYNHNQGPIKSSIQKKN